MSASTSASRTGWGALLDRLEERLRLIERSSVTDSGLTAAQLGPEPTDADRPGVPPTTAERLRLLALLAAHERLEARLRQRQRQHKQAEYYQLGTS